MSAHHTLDFYVLSQMPDSQRSGTIKGGSNQ